MRYWLLQSNEVLGPFDPEALARLPNFSVDSLVCPDGRRGTGMGDWLRAGTVSDLASALSRVSSERAPAGPPAQERAVVASLLERTAQLEDALERLKAAALAKEKELL